jgi:pimeloyl-ACP methyl ester carboxylesterase
MELYREIRGGPELETVPLLLIHGGGSTIETNFGALLPLVAKTRQVVAVELQGHGRTPSTDRPYTFKNSAEDVAEVLVDLGLGVVDVLGFSNGGNVALQLSMEHPELVRRQIVASAFYRRDGMVEGFFEQLENAMLQDMPQLYRDADAALNPDPAHQQQLFDLDTSLMRGVVDIADEDLARISIPTLVVAGDRDVVRTESASAMAAQIPGARLLILPAGHGDYLGEQLASGDNLELMHATLPWILNFLDVDVPRPFTGV